jgi:hypothetical protein
MSLAGEWNSHGQIDGPVGGSLGDTWCFLPIFPCPVAASSCIWLEVRRRGAQHIGCKGQTRAWHRTEKSGERKQGERSSGISSFSKYCPGQREIWPGLSVLWALGGAVLMERWVPEDHSNDLVTQKRIHSAYSTCDCLWNIFSHCEWIHWVSKSISEPARPKTMHLGPDQFTVVRSTPLWKIWDTANRSCPHEDSKTLSWS